MKRVLRFAALVLTAFSCITACAQQLSTKEMCPETIALDNNGRRACLNPKKWTGDYIPTDIQSLFVEAQGEVEVKPSKPRPWQKQVSRPSWIDNQRIIVSVNSYNGWTAEVDELPKVLIFNVDTGHVEETPYRGQIRCLSPEGNLLLEDKPSRSTRSRKFGDTSPREEYFFKGQLGQALTRYLVSSMSIGNWGVNEYTCNHVTDLRKEISPGRFLRKGDGFIAWPNLFRRELFTRLLNEDDEVVYIFKELDKCNRLYSPLYLPWLNKYFSSIKVGDTHGGFCPDGAKYSWLISATGVEIKELPPFFQVATTFGQGLAANGDTYWARRGQYISISNYRKAPDLLGGLYWQDEKTSLTKRVLKQAFRLDVLSPNGCRSFNDDVILELCKGD